MKDSQLLHEAREKKAVIVLGAIVFVTALCRRLSRFFDVGFAGTWGDDFYYYLKIAMNIVAGKGSTFDGTIPTNGYHPLWLVCLTAIVKIFGSYGTLVAVSVVIAATTTLVFAQARALAARLIGSRGAVSMAIGVYSAAYFYSVAKYGMELILTVPAMLYFMLHAFASRDRLGKRASLVATGFLAAVIVLCRIDAVVYVGLFALGYLIFSDQRTVDPIGKLGAFLLGFSPVFLYALSNRWLFGGFVQISGAAKQLAGPSLHHLRLYDFAIASRFIHYFYLDASFIALWSAIAIVVFSKVLRDKFERWVVVAPILAFNICYYLLQAVMSDWPLWDWYLYPVMAATPVALATVALFFRSQTRLIDDFVDAQLSRPATSAVLLALALTPFAWALATWRIPLAVSPMLSLARAVATFAETHPGRYAMGDRAGTVGYVLPLSLVQLEGLVEDRRMLEHIKGRHDLADVLVEYGIDYYVSSAPVKDGPCYRTKEPFQAGPSSPKMRGLFCQPPVMVHEAADGTLSLIFDVAHGSR